MTQANKKKDVLLRAVQFGMYALLLSPLVFYTNFLFFYTSTKAYFILALTQIIFVLFLWLCYRRPEYIPKFNWISKTFFAFVGVLLITSLTGIDPSFSFWSSIDRVTGGLMWLHLAAMFIVLTGVFKTKEDWRKLLIVSTSVALVVAGIQLLSFAGIELLISAAGGSTFGNSSFFSTYLLFHIFFAAYLALMDHPKQTKRYGAIAFLTLATTLLFTPTHAAIYAFLGGCVLLASLLSIFQNVSVHQKRFGCALFVGLVIAFSAVVVLAFQPGSVVYEKFIDHSTGSRFIIWDMALEGIQERPLLGWGLENFQYVSLEFYNPCLGSELCGPGLWFDRSHNKILDVLVESGFIGLVFYGSIFVSVLFGFWRARKRESFSGIVPAVIFTALAVHGIQTLTILDTSTTLLFWVITLAFASVASESAFMGPLPNRSTAQQPSSKPCKKIIPVIATCLLPFTFFHFVFAPIRANASVKAVLVAQSEDERLAHLAVALKGSPHGVDIRRVYISNKVAESLWKTDPERFIGIEDAIQHQINLITDALHDTIDTSPNYLRAYLELAFISQVEGRYFDVRGYQEAVDTLEVAIEQNPEHPHPHWALAGVSLELGQYDRAVELTKKILDQNPDFAKAYIYYFVALLYAGDQEVIEQEAARMIELYPILQSDIQALLEADLEANKSFLLLQFH